MENVFDKGVVSVVIPCRNEVNYIERCLRSLIDSDFPKDKLQVFVCDGMSEDGTRVVVDKLHSQYPFIHLLDNPKRVTPVAMNTGIRASTSEFVLIMGAHSELHPDYIKECLNILNTSEKVGGVGGVLENVYETELSKAIGYAMSSRLGVGNAHFRTGTYEGPVDTIGTPLYRRKTLNEVGLFNEELARNQDDELNYRIRKAGYILHLTSKVDFKYYVRSSFEGLQRQYFQYGYWKVLVNKMHGTVTTLRQLVPAGFILFLLFTTFLGIFFYPFWVCGALVSLFYFLVLGISALNSGSHAGSVFSAYVLIHFSYGAGYLQGIWHFLVLGRNAGVHKKLSR